MVPFLINIILQFNFPTPNHLHSVIHFFLNDLETLWRICTLLSKTLKYGLITSDFIVFLLRCGIIISKLLFLFPNGSDEFYQVHVWLHCCSGCWMPLLVLILLMTKRLNILFKKPGIDIFNWNKISELHLKKKSSKYGN